MRTIMKMGLVVALLITASTTSFAQKFGYINTAEVFTLMPEKDSADVKIQALQQELMDQLDAMQVELNKKYDDFQKNQATYSDAVKELKTQEFADMQQRYQNLQQTARTQLDQAQAELYNPLIEKIQQAIEKISKSNGYTLVFNLAAESLAYYDKTTMTDLMPLIKTELKLKEPAAADTAAADSTATK